MSDHETPLRFILDPEPVPDCTDEHLVGCCVACQVPLALPYEYLDDPMVYGAFSDLNEVDLICTACSGASLGRRPALARPGPYRPGEHLGSARAGRCRPHRRWWACHVEPDGFRDDPDPTGTGTAPGT